MNQLTLYSKVLITYGQKFILAAIIIGVAWLVAITIKKLIVRIADNQPHQKTVFQVMGDFSKVTIIIIGIVTGLGSIGLNVSAIVAGLGLSGFAFGFALKDYLSNILAGVMIMIYQPYHLGDSITVGSSNGSVKEINLRYTVLEDDLKKILIPNSTMLNSSITILK